MLNRILTGWTVKRVFYVVIGLIIIIQFAQTKQWWGILFGLYYTSMGIFQFGCAGGNCYTPTFKENNDKKTIPDKTEEIKQ